jgi:hypothetical protein
MEKLVGQLEVVCNAPPYPIVQASVAVGVERPEDSRWEHTTGASECSCGEPLPLKLPLYRFTYSSGDEVTYGVHQCCCKRVFWASIES